MKKNFSKIGAVLICSITLIGNSLTLMAAETDANTKDEIVYINLDNSGNVEKINVINYFKMKNNTLQDKGNYDSIKNLSTVDKLDYDGKIVSGEISEELFYYQGILSDTEMPWNISITYTLDNNEISPDSLAGKSGKLEIELKVRQNTTMDSSYQENFALQATMQLSSEVASNVIAENATIANVGKLKQMSYIIFPGKDADYKITADVIDFEMPSISINGIPLSINIDEPDTASLKQQITDLQEGISTLDDGASKLNKGLGKAATGASQLSEALQKLKTGSATYYSAFGQLSGNSTALLNGMSQYNSGVNSFTDTIIGFDTTSLDQLTSGVSSLASGSAEYKKSLNSLISSYEGKLSATKSPEEYAAYTELVAVLTSLRNGYTNLDNGISALSGNIDLSFINELKSGANTLKSGFSELNSSVESYIHGADQLYSSYEAVNNGISEATTGASTLRSGLASAKQGSDDMLDGTNTLVDETTDMDSIIDDKIQELLDQYSNDDLSYVSFADPSNENISAVQFVIHTAGISIEEDSPIEEETEGSSESFVERFFNLFK